MELKDCIGVEIKNKGDILNYLDCMKGLDREIMVVFGINEDLKFCLAEDVTEISEKDNGYFYSSSIFKALKKSKSIGFILVHNHPNGVIIPTQDDVDTTKNIMKEAEKKDLVFMEHFVYCNGILWSIIRQSIKGNVYFKKESIRSKDD